MSRHGTARRIFFSLEQNISYGDDGGLYRSTSYELRLPFGELTFRMPPRLRSWRHAFNWQSSPSYTGDSEHLDVQYRAEVLGKMTYAVIPDEPEADTEYGRAQQTIDYWNSPKFIHKRAAEAYARKGWDGPKRVELVRGLTKAERTRKV